MPSALSEGGKAAGYAARDGTNYIAPVVWSSNGVPSVLPTPPTAQAHIARFATEQQGVGLFITPNGSLRPAVFTAGGMTILPSQNTDAALWAGNDTTYVGEIAVQGGSAGAVWQSGSLFVLNVPAEIVRPFAINRYGEYVGYWFSHDELGNETAGALVGQGANAHILSLPEYMHGPAAFDINDVGTIVGSFRNSNGGYQAFVRKSDGSIALPEPLPGTTDTYAPQINNFGTAVGVNADSDGNETAVAYFNGSLVPTDLNTLIDPLPGNVKLVRGLDVNDAGQMLTWGISQTDGSWHYYILSPVPEPGTLSAVAVLLAAFSRRGRRGRRRS